MARRGAGVLGAGLAALSLLGCTAVLGAPPGERTFYVSPGGDDTALGTSPGTAWRTLERASGARLAPGESLLLEGGARFTGRLLLDAADAGDPLRPVRVGSYGTGRAVIEAPDDAAVAVVGTGGVEIADLVVVGAPDGIRPGSAGVRLYADAGRHAHVAVERVEASGFVHGLDIGAAAPGAGFDDVRVSDADLHDNRDAGLASYGPAFDPDAPAYAHAGVLVERVRARDNKGDPANTEHNTGSGIVLGSVRDAVVRGSVAHDNGGAGGAGEGPIGIWTYDADRVVVEHSLAYRNRTRLRADGGGFGLDQNTSRSVLQYNLSHSNHGPGYLVYTGEDNAAHRDSTVRWNISSGDAQRWDVYGGITVLGRVDDVRILHNTVVMGPQDTRPSTALRLGPGISGVQARNNVLLAERAGAVVFSERPYGPDEVVLAGNSYATRGRPWEAWWGGQVYGSLAQWRAGTGQETADGAPTGDDADPRLRGPVLGLTATEPDDAGVLAGFAPVAGSPLRGAGLPVFDADPAPVDALGTPVDPGTPDVGAVQVPR